MYFSLTKSFYHLSETAKGKRGIVHYNPLWMQNMSKKAEIETENSASKLFFLFALKR